MTDRVPGAEFNVRKRWRRFGIALFVLIPLDLFTTLLAVSTYGLAVEANPVMRWLLRRGLIVTTAVHLFVGLVVIALFHVTLGWIDRLSPSDRRTFVVVVDLWTATLLAGGVLVISNNLLAIA